MCLWYERVIEKDRKNRIGRRNKGIPKPRSVEGKEFEEVGRELRSIKNVRMLRRLAKTRIHISEIQNITCENCRQYAVDRSIYWLPL
jgi:hypothetical protein